MSEIELIQVDPYTIVSRPKAPAAPVAEPEPEKAEEPAAPVAAKPKGRSKE